MFDKFKLCYIKYSKTDIKRYRQGNPYLEEFSHTYKRYKPKTIPERPNVIL